MVVTHMNTFVVTITYVTTQESVHEVWDEINALHLLPRHVDIDHVDTYRPARVNENEKV